MGKPRLIILIRHAQSEGNTNRAIHQLVPDHRVKLTEEGWKQAEDAGHRLRALLSPDDTLQVFTSPYRRTRETTEGILRTLTSPSPSTNAPSPFSRDKIVVYEEPRLREQDFGNFQPCSAEMERMWRERADYGHFFYRIPNGESAADAYDRVSGFNESLWRQFGDQEFPSVLVLVTHGLMSRVFLMKWYHWSVEYFEDLRNVNHCEFVLMRQNTESGKFVLESQLRTWSELKRQRAEEAARKNPNRRNTLSAFLKHPEKSPSIPARKWGGCPEGCDHSHAHGERGKEGGEAKKLDLPPSSSSVGKNEADDHALANHESVPAKADATTASENNAITPMDPSDKLTSTHSMPTNLKPQQPQQQQDILRQQQQRPPRIPSGAATPHERPSSDSEGEEVELNDYFAGSAEAPTSINASSPTSGRTLLASALRRKTPERKPTPEDLQRWVGESGMGSGRQADALGDEPAPEDSAGEDDGRGRARNALAPPEAGEGYDSLEASPHPDEEEEAWHEARGWEFEGPATGEEIGRNAVERLVEQISREEEDEEVEREKGVRGSVY